MKQSIRYLLLFLVILLVNGTFLYGARDIKVTYKSVMDTRATADNLAEHHVTKGFYRGGSLLYANDDDSINMLTTNQYFTYKLGRFQEHIIDSALTYVPDFEEYGVLQISSISNDKISFKYGPWNESRAMNWQYATVGLDQEVDLNNDGFNDIRWENGDTVRTWQDYRYLTFISSQEDKHVAMYQLKKEWTPKGEFPGGIISISPSSHLVVNSGERRKSISVADEYYAVAGDYLISPEGDLKIIGDVDLSDSLTIEELMVDSVYNMVAECGIYDIYEYNDEITVENTETDRGTKGWSPFLSLLSLPDDIYLIGDNRTRTYAKANGHLGVLFNFRPSFKTWWVGLTSKIIIDVKPLIDINLDLQVNEEGSNPLNPMPTTPGFDVNLVEGFAGVIRLGDIELELNTEIEGDANIQCSYKNTSYYTAEYSLEAGFSFKKGFRGNLDSHSLGGNVENDEEEFYSTGLQGTELDFSLTPTIKFLCGCNCGGALSAEAGYSLELKNSISFTNPDSEDSEPSGEYSMTLIGNFYSEVKAGWKKRFKAWWHPTFTINLAFRWYEKFGEFSKKIVSEPFSANMFSNTEFVDNPIEVLNRQQVPIDQYQLNRWKDAGCLANLGSVNIDHIINVKTDFGATGDGSSDDTDNVLNALDRANSYTDFSIVYFPEGVYKIADSLLVGGSTCIIGDGYDKTKLKFVSKIGSTISDDKILEKPLTCIQINSQQMVGIQDLSISHDIENAYWSDEEKRLKMAGRYTIYITGNSSKCWVQRVEMEEAKSIHIGISGSSRNIEIRNCYIHDTAYRGTKGNGYGVTMSGSVSKCLVENNIFRNLRHSMIVVDDVNNCVFGYNASIDPLGYADESKYDAFNTTYDFASDMVFHSKHEDTQIGPYENLVEGNLLNTIIFDNSQDEHVNGPNNVIFRNHATRYGFMTSDCNNGTQGWQIVFNNLFSNCRAEMMGSALSHVVDGWTEENHEDAVEGFMDLICITYDDLLNTDLSDPYLLYAMNNGVYDLEKLVINGGEAINDINWVTETEDNKDLYKIRSLYKNEKPIFYQDYQDVMWPALKNGFRSSSLAEYSSRYRKINSAAYRWYSGLPLIPQPDLKLKHNVSSESEKDVSAVYQISSNKKANNAVYSTSGGGIIKLTPGFSVDKGATFKIKKDLNVRF